MATIIVAGCSQTPVAPWNDRELREITSPDLRRFSSEAEFDAYVKRIGALADERGFWWSNYRIEPGSGLLAQNADEVECDPSVEDCGELEEISVSGSRASSSANQTITNNQESGVDEGDIVKNYKNFLIVLQHGRLFSVDMGSDVTGLQYVDRIDVYTSPATWTWYDELLISDNKLIVTGFNYGEDATEISLFEISEAGVFTRLTTYLITSEDYYSSYNYATRLVSGNLVIYTPLYLFDYDVDEGVVVPLYRQRRPDGSETFWQPLFSVTDIFWPIQDTFQPVVHTISVCPIDGADGFACRSTGIVGPDQREFYVSPEYAYIWNTQDPYELEELGYMTGHCSSSLTDSRYAALPAALYRIPLFGGDMAAVRTTGVPLDQFSLDARDSGFHALLRWDPVNCWADSDVPLRYVRIDNGEFRRAPVPDDVNRYVSVPPSRSYWPQNRYTEDYLAYSDDEHDAWQVNEYERSDIIVVPLDNPTEATRIPLGHSAERLEVFGDGLVANGYYYGDGLFLSTISLSDRPGVADTEYLHGYVESEGRSHAFNLRVDEDRGGMFGVPVTIEVPYRSWTRQRDNSDVAFFAVGAGMRMDPAGLLTSTADLADPGYECEVSCYDWYGNARPVFINGRTFALSGSELIEGEMRNGQIAETGRLSLLATPSHWLSAREAGR